MPKKHDKLEEIAAKLRQVDVLVSQDRPVADAIRSTGVTEATQRRLPQHLRAARSQTQVSQSLRS